MNRTILRLCLMAGIVFSFVAGYLFHLLLVVTPLHQDLEPTQHELRELRREAEPFLYKTMRDIFDGTYNPRDPRSQSARDRFEKHKLTLEPKCRLIDLYPQYNTLTGELVFPSGDTFEVHMKKTPKEWVLVAFNYLGSWPFYQDLQIQRKQESMGQMGN